MSNYTKTVDFAAKDGLSSGASGKLIKGTEFETEFDNIVTAIATKADIAGPTFTGTLTYATLNDGTTALTSTVAELNILDGVTSTAAELNILDGVTSTAAELNILDGKAFLDENNFASDSATGIASQQSIKAYVDGSVSSVTPSSTTTLTNKTLTSPKINEDVAVTSTATELNLLDGVTSTTAELNILDGVTSTAAELNILDGVTSTAAELNILDGVTSTAAELNLLDALDRGSLLYGNASGATAVLGQGSANQVLTSDGTDIAWAAAGGAYSSWLVKTANFTCASGDQLICNHASTAFTITLPAGSAGDTVTICNAGAALVTVGRNGSEKINSVAADGSVPNGNSTQLVYVDGTIGWFEV